MERKKSNKIFGVNIRGKGGLELTRENYCMVSKRSSFKNRKEEYDDKWCKNHYRDCMINYDLNSKYFESLSVDDFNESINTFLKGNKKFLEIKNLNEWDCVSGYYMMVLDKYKQAYIGTTKNIKQRIMGHWSKKKPFDRLLFGGVNNSILSIDSFRIMDTSRIYAYYVDDVYAFEDTFIRLFPQKFLLNRIGGGALPSGLDGFIYAANTMKTRKFQ